MGMGGQRHAPAALPPRMTRYQLYRRLGGPQGWARRGRKLSPPPECDPRTVQSTTVTHISEKFDVYTKLGDVL